MDEWAILLNNRIVKRFTISEGQSLTIGRGSDADVQVDNTAISRQHSSLELKGGTYYITDHYSLNGTKVNGERIESAVPINMTDVIEVGKFLLKPTAGLNADEVSASSAASMDNNDETIFVSGKSKNISQQVARENEPTLTVIEGKGSPASLSLKGLDSIKVGKDRGCNITISGWFVGGTQFFVSRRKDGFHIIPQVTWAKTRVNGTPITSEQPLNRGDIIMAGKNSMRFE
ncbi:MAG: FHA domain-containing protein [Proteobacteria bacterium]|nr:FHA domain-containing protein [Pseudomonadota bacterium]MBU1738702.1 FHA domain-containing protein [Pseudomonadota bacterium]